MSNEVESSMEQSVTLFFYICNISKSSTKLYTCLLHVNVMFTKTYACIQKGLRVYKVVYTLMRQHVHKYVYKFSIRFTLFLMFTNGLQFYTLISFVRVPLMYLLIFYTLLISNLIHNFYYKINLLN